MAADGGPAFPLEGYSTGMSLRDYFAAQALIGIIGRADTATALEKCGEGGLAQACYVLADALLAERAK